MATRVGQHCVPRRISYRFSRPLRCDQENGKLPSAGPCKERHSREADGVAGNGDHPIAACAVGEVAREKAQSIAKEFAKSGDKTDDSPTRPEHAEIGACDT